MKKNILVVAAHPDDEVLGCAGTIARLVHEGNRAYVLILGEGITSREQRHGDKSMRDSLRLLKQQAQEANKALRVKRIIMRDFPDNKFDTVPFLSIVKEVEKVKKEVNPDIIFTHFDNDLNIDHRITYQAVVTAARPLAKERVKQIYSFEVLSSTEWNFPYSFSPDVFFDISGYMEAKLRALSKYKSEMRTFPHPRSIQGIKISAGYWGMRVGMRYAEAFKTVRIIK